MMFNIDLDKLKLFYYVAKAKKFTTAAEMLNISQPALSRNIQLLEERLGTKLFYRHARGLTLTAQGELMIPVIGNFLNEIQTTAGKLYEEEKEPKGPLKAVVSSGLMSAYLLNYVPEFLTLYPEIRLTLIANDTIPSLTFGEAHVLISHPLQGTEAEGLTQDLLLKSYVGLYASKEYLKEFGVPKTPKDLDNHQLIAFGDHPESESFKHMNCLLTLGTTPDYVREPFIQANLPQARLALAQAGLGIAAIYKDHPGLSESGLIQVLPDTPMPVDETYYIYPKELETSKKVIVFRDYLKKAFTRDYGNQ